MKDVVTITVEKKHSEYLRKRKDQKKVPISGTIQQALDEFMEKNPNEEKK